MEENQENKNEQTDQVLAMADTGDGSQPAGSKDQDQAGKWVQDQPYRGDQDQAGKTTKFITTKVIKDAFDTICDQHSETTESLTNLTELVQQNRANNEIIKQQVGAISGVVIEVSRLTQEIYGKITQ